MRGVALLSSGIDSPVAIFLMVKKGVEVVAVHFDNHNLIDNSTCEKAKRLVRHLSKITGRRIKLYVVPNGENQRMIAEKCLSKYICVICKRLMLAVAEEIAKKEKCSFLITGENLAQVASQTLVNLVANSKAVSMPILRPLLCNDKVETIELAKKIGTYPISIEKSAGCPVLPKYPSTKANIKKVEMEEKKINIRMMIKKLLKNAEIFTF